MGDKTTVKLAIYDKGGGNFEAAAREAAVAALSEECVPVFNEAGADAVNRLRAFTHIVCHLLGNEVPPREPSWRKLIDGQLAGVQVIVRVSSQGANGMDSFEAPCRHQGTGPWILHMTEPSGVVTVDRWKEIFRAMKEWDTSGPTLPIGIRAIFDPHPEIRHALRLLCEAWLLNKGDASREHPCKGSGQTSKVPILIRAPITPAQWLDPFECEASEIVNQAGGARRQAETLLTKLASRPVTSQVTWEEFEDDVTNLRDALAVDRIVSEA